MRRLLALYLCTAACSPTSMTGAPDAGTDTRELATDTNVEDIVPSDGPSPPASRPFSEACNAKTYRVCGASSHAVTVDVTSYSASSRIVRVRGGTVLAEPARVVWYWYTGAPRTLSIADPGRPIDLSAYHVLICDDAECRAYQLNSYGDRADRLPGSLPKTMRAVIGGETVATFAGEGIHRWDGAWTIDVPEGSFHALHGSVFPTRNYIAVGDGGLIVIRDEAGVRKIPSGTTTSLRHVGWNHEGITVVNEAGDLFFGNEAGMSPCTFGGLKIANMQIPGLHHDRMVGATTDGRVFAVGPDATICVEQDPAPDTRAAVVWACGLSLDRRMTITTTKVLGSPNCYSD